MRHIHKLWRENIYVIAQTPPIIDNLLNIETQQHNLGCTIFAVDILFKTHIEAKKRPKMKSVNNSIRKPNGDIYIYKTRNEKPLWTPSTINWLRQVETKVAGLNVLINANLTLTYNNNETSQYRHFIISLSTDMTRSSNNVIKKVTIIIHII